MTLDVPPSQAKMALDAPPPTGHGPAAAFWSWLEARLKKVPEGHERLESIDAIEKDVAHMLDWFEVKFTQLRVALRPYRGVLMFSIGAVACFYGRNFTYSILFLQAFKASGWPIVQRASGELGLTYRRTRNVLKQELPNVIVAKQTLERLQPQLLEVKASFEAARARGDEAEAARILTKLEGLQTDVAKAMHATSSLSAISRSIDPEKVMEILRGVYNGTVACLATAMSGGIGKFGVGVNFGKMLTELATNVVKPAVLWLMRRTADKAPSVKVLVEDPNSEKWVDFLVRMVCNSAGVAVAFYFDELTFTVSNAMIGSEIMVHQLNLLAATRGLSCEDTALATGLQWALCGAGSYRQLIGGKAKLPLPLAVVLSGPLLGEKWLRGVAAVLRTTGGPGLQP